MNLSETAAAVLLVGLAVLVLLLGYAVVALSRSQQEAKDADDLATALADDLKRTRWAVTDAITPAAWTWDLVDGLPVGGIMADHHRRLRAYTATLLGTLQKALDLDDVEMAAAMEDVDEAPRRMPRYPQVPAFIAKAEDAVTGLAASASMTDLSGGIPKDQTMVVDAGHGEFRVPLPAEPQPPTDDSWKVDVKVHETDGQAPLQVIPKTTEDTGQPRVTPNVTGLYEGAETPDVIKDGTQDEEAQVRGDYASGEFSVRLVTPQGVELGREAVQEGETVEAAIARLQGRHEAENLAVIDQARKEAEAAHADPDVFRNGPRDPFAGMES